MPLNFDFDHALAMRHQADVKLYFFNPYPNDIASQTGAALGADCV